MEGGIEVGILGDRRLVLEAIAAALSALPGIEARWWGAAAPDAAPGVWLVEDGANAEGRASSLRAASPPGTPVLVLATAETAPSLGTEREGAGESAAAATAGTERVGAGATVGTERVGAGEGIAALAARLREAVASPGEVGRPSPSACPLSARELTVLGALAGGLTQDAVGEALGVSQHTVRAHVQHAMVKLGVGSRRAAIDTARGAGWLPPVNNGASP